jgi:ABC-type nitrate/sulfonate/bicarbonate transport system ATPase subunit
MAAVTVGISIDVSEKRYAGDRPIIALRNLETRIQPGEFCVITGPSGCGKTTLLNIVAGLDKDFAGVLGLEPPGAGSPRIGYVFQNPRLLPWRTVRENVALVLPPQRDRREVEGLLDDVGLADAADLYPTRLSGGMARRAALARAFAITPDLLLLDEPFVSLDAPAADRLRGLLVRLVTSRPLTVLFVTHELAEAVALADRVLVLSPAPGRIVAEMPIPLPRERRHDGGTLAGLQAQLARLAGIQPGRSSLRIPSS